MNALIKVLLIALVYLVSIQASAVAQSPPRAPACIAIEAMVSRLDQLGASVIVLAGPERDRAIADYNARPPVTDTAWDQVMMVNDLPEGLHALMFAKDGKVCDRALFDAQGWKAIQHIILGDRS